MPRTDRLPPLRNMPHHEPVAEACHELRERRASRALARHLDGHAVTIRRGWPDGYAASGRNDAEHRRRRTRHGCPSSIASTRRGPRSSSYSGALRQTPRRWRARGRPRASAGVRRPVNVFCWLGWYVPTGCSGPIATSAPCANRGFGRGVAWPSAASALSAASQPIAPSATMTRSVGEQLDLADEVRPAASPAPRASACSPAARSGPRRRSGRRGARARRRHAGSPAGPRGPTACIARHRKSPEASPVNTRPVRLPPCAAGASPTRRMRAAGSPKPGHRPGPVGLVAEPGDLDPTPAPRARRRGADSAKQSAIAASSVGRSRAAAAAATGSAWGIGRMLPAPAAT